MGEVTPFYTDDWLTLYGGDCRTVLASLPSDSVDCVVTSPPEPYWGLRDYGTATWEGGDAECDHKHGRFERPGLSSKQASNNGSGGDEAARSCRKCGATRSDSQLGLERTPEEYVANMVEVFREVRRVLKPSGTCWLNLGDSYAAGGGSGPQRLDELGERLGTGGGKKHSSRPSGRAPSAGLAQKQLVGIPWRVAFALQADGWYLRSDIIWSKPNPMPESVTDRPTKSHEYLFLLTKQARYYFDADAVREPNVSPEQAAHNERYAKVYDAHTERVAVRGEGIQPGNVNNVGIHARGGATVGRNIRSVWTIATRPYPGAHFAVFPPELPERCIKAGSSEKGVCPECGAPWERVVERPVAPADVFTSTTKPQDGKVYGYHKDGVIRGAGQRLQDWRDANPPQTTGWRPTCRHTGGPSPAVILDPFGGSGTVGMVANRLSRRAILIDLNPEYLKQQMKRNAQTPLGLDAA